MKKIFLICIIVTSIVQLKAQVVTSLVGNYRNGQTFLVWKNIPNYTSEFYFVYRYYRPITKSNIDSAKYMGRIPHDYSFNYFLNLGTDGGNDGNPLRYMVINNNPTETLDATQGLYVATCSDNKTQYYAVTSDSAGVENRRIVPGSNSLVTGVAEQVAPIQAIEQFSGLPLLDNPILLYDAWVVFGGNIGTQYTPAMANEGCLVFNFGIVKDVDPKGPNSATFFFYGGGGNAYNNCNGDNLPGNWKISMEDDIPNFNWDPVAGENTKWIGYHDNFDVYGANKDTPWPTTGIDKTYTIQRVKWTYDWLLRAFPGDIDPHSIYTQGSSSGCTGAMLFGYLYPGVIAAVDVTNAKVNINYLQDDNPTCKWNIDGSTRVKSNIFIGDYITDLPTDMPRLNGTGNYRMYEMADFNVLLADSKNISLPVFFLTSGQQDNVTCWDEKVPFYESLNNYKSGGFFYWDQRAHKGGTHEIQDRPLSNLTRYHNNLSYPAFQNCSADSYPGDTLNPNPPFFNGDSVGTKFGELDWVDTSIHETSNSWQAIIYADTFNLLNGASFPYNMPQTIKTDITLRRLQQFVNIPNGAKICMDNYQKGVLVQSKSVVYKKSNGLITFKKVKISRDSNLVKIYLCPQKPLEENTYNSSRLESTLSNNNVYPNPTAGKSEVDFTLSDDASVQLIIKDLLGKQVSARDAGILSEGDHVIPFDLSSFTNGVYLVELHVANQVSMYKVVKH